MNTTPLGTRILRGPTKLKPSLASILAHPLRDQILAFTATRTVLNTMYRMVYPFLAVFGRGLGVDLVALSLALTARSLLGAFGPFLAVIADSKGRKAGMLFGLVLFITGTSLVALWPSYLTFILALMLTLMGKYVFDPSLQAYLGDRISYRRRGLVIAATEIGWSLSFILGVPLVGLLITLGGWMAPFPLLALLGALAFGLLAWMLPGEASTPETRPSLWDNLLRLLKHSPALAGISMGLLLSAANEMVNLIFGVWLEDSFGIRIAVLGAASAVIGLSELSGELMAGGLTDRLGKPRAVAAGLLLNSLAALALPFLGRSLPGATIGLFLFYVTFEFTLVSTIPLMTEVLPSARATLMAANVAGLSLGRALGALLGPSIYALGRAFPFSSEISASVLATVGFNLLALAALNRLRHVGRPGRDQICQ